MQAMTGALPDISQVATPAPPAMTLSMSSLSSMVTEMSVQNTMLMNGTQHHPPGAQFSNLMYKRSMELAIGLGDRVDIIANVLSFGGRIIKANPTNYNQINVALSPLIP